MADMKKTFELLSAVGKVAYRFYKKDRDHYVRLLEPYTVGRFLIDVPDFDCALFTISDGTLILKPAEAKHCDGATLAPDKIGRADFACAYIPHDFWYEMIDEMARDERFKEAGLDAARLRKIGDAMLGALMKCKSGLWARLYYWAVRTFGGLARRFHAVALTALASLLVGGCAGCLSLPDGIFEPSDSDPVYETVPRDASAVNPGHDAVSAALGGRRAVCPYSCARTIAADCRAFWRN